MEVNANRILLTEWGNAPLPFSVLLEAFIALIFRKDVFVLPICYQLGVDVPLFTSARTESCSRYCFLHDPSSAGSFGCIQSHTLTFVVMKGVPFHERNSQLKAFST